MKKIALLLLIGLLLSTFSFGQKKTYTTHIISNTPPLIDGLLNDKAWETIDWGNNFIQHQPYEGKEASQRTAFKVLYDDNFLYVGIKCFDSDPDSIVTRTTRRDNTEGDDTGIAIDSYFDKQTAFGFFVNSAGVKLDGVFTENGEKEDFTWDPIWYVKTSIDKDGWNAEMKIPFTQLRFENNQKNMVWGFQVVRMLFRKEELSLWQEVPQNSPGWVHLMGELHGISGIHPKKQIEIAPYTVAKVERFAKDEDNPFETGKSSSIHAGVDGKIGVTNNLTLDFTINPDFGQVEADPSEVNLTAFETFFEEKRPFFIEGKNIFNYNLMPGDGPMSSENLFYSRRIGRSPQGDADLDGPNDDIDDSDKYVNTPENTPILGALKLSGKTKNGWSIGIMESVTSKVRAEIDSLGSRSFQTVEPYTNYFISSLQKDINKGNTIIGGMFTATNRNLETENLNFLNKAAYTGGINFTHNWKEKTYFVNLKTFFSHIKGDSTAITDAQLSSKRYFQRPDADYLTVDSTRTSLTGSGGVLQIGKGGNSKLRYALFLTYKSPELELNDVGYMRMTDNISEIVWIGYRIGEPFSIFRNFNINFNQWRNWDFGGTNKNNGGNTNMFMQFKNYWRLGTGINFNSERISNSELRGGPSIKLPGGINHWMFIGSDNRKKLTTGFVIANYWGNRNFSRNKHSHMDITYRPINALSITLNPSLDFNKRELQYVTDADDHYIFASLDQKEFSASVRINYSITPDFSIQYWGQPFISSGKYSNYKEITNPKASNLSDRYALIDPSLIRTEADGDDVTYFVDPGDGNEIDFEEPNYTVRDFRSNLVARWEYTPGSTIYLVWTQGRNSEVSSGTMNFRDDMKGMFKTFPHNVFLIKLSYRFKN